MISLMPIASAIVRWPPMCFYKEDTDQVEVAFPGGTGTTRPVMVVDTQNPYAELGPCDIPASGFTWTLPYASDWAIAIGDFDQADPTGSFDCTTLPVELNQFDAASDGTDILLTWSTSSELNNAGFEVQFKANNLAYQTHSFIEGQGTTPNGHSYSILLPDYPPETYTFRLKQIDFDGTFEYSNEVVHTHEASSAFIITQAYPTPFQEKTTLTLSVARSQRVEATLYDALGRAIRTVFSEDVTAHTTYPIYIKAGALPNGSYFIQMKGEYFHSNERIILAR